MQKTIIILLLALLVSFVSIAATEAEERSLWISDDYRNYLYHVTPTKGDLLPLNEPCLPPYPWISGIAIDPLNDTLWGAFGGGNSRIVNFSKDCTQVLLVINTSKYDFLPDYFKPEGVSVSADPFDNTLWFVLDTDPSAPGGSEGMVFHIEKSGRLLDSFSTLLFGAKSPQAISVDPFDGTLWITNNAFPQGIYHVSEQGDGINFIPEEYFTDNRKLQGIAVDPKNDTLWVTARSIDGVLPGQIFNITPQGKHLSSFDSTSYDLESRNPTGIAVDGYDINSRFINYCAYGYKDDIIINPDAIVDCTAASLGLRAYKKLQIKERSNIGGNLHSQMSNVEVDKEVHIEGKIFAGEDAKLGERSFLGGHITAGHKVEVKAGAEVSGDITAADEVKIDSKATVKGKVLPFTPVPSIPGLTFVKLKFNAGKKDIEVRNRVDLVPGSYRELKVKKGAVITLYSGHYVVKKFEVENDGKILLALSGGPVVVDVMEKVTLQDRVKMMESDDGDIDPGDVLFRIAKGDVKLEKEGFYIGTFIAADNNIELQEDAMLTGAMYGKKVEIKKRAIFYGKSAIRAYLSVTGD